MSRVQAWWPASLSLKSRKPKEPLARPGRFLQVLNLEDRITPANFVVVSLADSGPDTLRQAILDANANPGPDTITFTVASGTITLVTEIAISDAVTITGGSHTISTASSIRLINTSSAPTGTAPRPSPPVWASLRASPPAPPRPARTPPAPAAPTASRPAAEVHCASTGTPSPPNRAAGSTPACQPARLSARSPVSPLACCAAIAARQ